jgi:site-specific recombinase XerD
MKRIYRIIEPINIASRATDPWQGISADVIRRFVDVLCAQHALPKELLETYHADLEALDHWLIETKKRTLVSATDEDVREYISVSLSCLRAFEV